jgi:hypothetical protein
MIQLTVQNIEHLPNPISFYLNIYNQYNEGQTTGRSLCTFTSQFTGKSKTVSLNTLYGSFNSRYIEFGLRTTRLLRDEDLLSANIQLGTTDFPLGFYDATIYNNTDNLNLDTTGLPVVWNGLMNLAGYSITATESVKYTEYTTNDADTESIYLTNAL